MEDTHLNYTFPFYKREDYELPANLLVKRSDPKTYGQYLNNRGKRNKKR